MSDDSNETPGLALEPEKKGKKTKAAKDPADPNSPSVAIDPPAEPKSDQQTQHDLIHHVGKH